MPGLPETAEQCDYDAFVHSPSINGKQFLYPWEKSDRIGDWLKAKGFCAAHCAEMVTIHSAAENKFFVDFMNSLGATGDYIWLGAETHRKKFTGWSNGEKGDYDNLASDSNDEAGITCLTAHSRNDWYNKSCLLSTVYVACQRADTQKEE